MKGHQPSLHHQECKKLAKKIVAQQADFMVLVQVHDDFAALANQKSAEVAQDHQRFFPVRTKPAAPHIRRR